MAKKTGTVVHVKRNPAVTIFDERGALISVDVRTEEEMRIFHNNGHQIRWREGAPGIEEGDVVEMHNATWPGSPFIIR